MNFSFAGCGFLGIYHVGVASCLKQHAPHLVKNCQFAGASAGALVACCLICDCCLGDCTTFTLRLATKARSYSIGPLHPNFKVANILRDAMREVLPDNAHELASGRLFISFTRVSDRKNVVVSEYNTKEELIQALLCSAHVPLYSGLVPPSYRGVRYVDGGLSDNIPAINEETISVSPFAGESDICPKDDSANTLHIYLANTSMQFTMGNLYRMSRALFPPHPEILSDMCQQGFDDCLKYLQNNGLISCVRHLSVRSIVMPVSDSEDSGMEDEATETCHEQDCQECKRKLQVALLDTLPHPVGSALKEACDSVNKGVTAYIQRYRPLRLLSYLATPWFLPVDIAFTYAVRFLEYLPHLPHDTRVVYRETADLLKYLVTNIHHHRRHYTARFRCQLAIQEVNYNQIETDIYPAPHHAHQHHIHTQSRHSSRKNLNFEFAVDFDSEFRKKSTASNTDVETAMGEEEQVVPTTRPRSDSAKGRLRSSEFHLREVIAQEIKDNFQLYDTFEHCLHVTNQMESAMAYYYQTEGQKDCFKFEEIYTLRDTDDEVPFAGLRKQEQEADALSLPSLAESRKRSLSLGEMMKQTPHLESDLEQFLEGHSNIMRMEKETPHFNADSV